MKIGRITAYSTSLLLGLSAAMAVSAHPWHVPHPHAPSVPTPSVHPLPTPHFHTPSGGGFWHAVPVVAPGAAHFAGRDWDHDHDHWHHDWGHGDIRYFHHYDWYAWHNGYWYDGWYGPRFGWWWVVSGVWFFYPAPVYPYPDPYMPADFQAPPPPAGQAAGQFWYFCPASNAYYPYVPSCPSGWQQVPVNSAPPPEGPPGG